MLDSERERVAAAARRLASEGLVTGTAGNVSMRADELVAVTPTGAVLDRVEADEVAVVDLEGNHLAGELEATSELGLHLGVYRRLGAGAVVHTHAPVATALSCVLDELPVVHYLMMGLGGPIRVAPYATFGSAELAELTLEALEGRSAALMSNHGTIALGPDPDAATEGTLLLEWAALIYWRAAAIGTPRALDAEQQRAFVETISARGYGAVRERGR
jgi:L-fuculose-phosphate aldolase